MKTGLSRRLYMLMLTIAMTMLFSLQGFAANQAIIRIKKPNVGTITLRSSVSGVEMSDKVTDGDYIVYTVSYPTMPAQIKPVQLKLEGTLSPDCCYWRRIDNDAHTSMWFRNTAENTSFTFTKDSESIDYTFELQDKHSLSFIEEVPATCDTDGTERYWKCIYCDKLFSDSFGNHEIFEPVQIHALGHDLTKVKAVAATCEDTGTKEYYQCNDCGKLFSDSAGAKEISKPEKIPALGHKLKKTDEVPATCEAKGTKAYYTCSVCSKLFSDSAGTKEIAKPEEIPASGHVWDEGKVTKEATMTSTGIRSYTCKNDKTHTKTEVIPKLTMEPMEEGSVTPDQKAKLSDVVKPLTDNSLSWKKDLPGSTFCLLRAKAAAKGSGSIKLSWKRVGGASKYIVYGKPYGKKYPFEKLYEGPDRKFTHKSLKTKKYYKYVVLAVNGENVLAISTSVYSSPGKSTKGNVKKVRLTPGKITIKSGKKKKISPAVTKTRKVKTYRKICFESKNTSVCTVSSKGKIKAVGASGTSTWIFAYAQNGVYAKIKVKVR